MKKLLSTLLLLISFIGFTQAQTQLIGKWTVVNGNGTPVSLDKQAGEIWYFYDYTENGVLSVIDEYGDETQIKGTGTLMGKFHGEPMTGLWHYEGGKILAIYTIDLMKILGANYEYRATVSFEQSLLVLDGTLCTNMGDGCKNSSPLKMKLKKVK